MKSQLLVAMFALTYVGQIQATTLFDFTQDNSTFTWFGNNQGCEAGCTLGYTFNVFSPLTINGLGVFDRDSDGLNNDHEVGLWNSSNTLIASTVVTTMSTSAESSASGAGNFVYASMPTLVLYPGTYTVGALFEIGDTDPVVFMASGIFSNNSDAAYEQAAFINAGVLSMPIPYPSLTTDRFFGAAIHVVPVPQAIWLFGSGLLGLFGVLKREAA